MKQWKNELPTEDGPYWLRHGSSKDEAIEMVHVHDGKIYYGGNSCSPINEKTWRRCWWLKVPFPEEIING